MEDNEADVFLIREAILEADLGMTIHVVTDGEQAIAFFHRADNDPSAPCPDLVLLDINLPRRPGGDVLRLMRQSRRCRGAHVIAVSTSDSPHERKAMADLGATEYFRKPSEYADFMKLGGVIRRMLPGANPAS